MRRGQQQKIDKHDFINLYSMLFDLRGHSLTTLGSRERGEGCKKSLHTLTLERGSNPFLRNIFQVDILY